MWEVEIACWTLLAEFCHYPTSALRSPSSADLELPRGPRAGSTAAGPRAVQTTSSYPNKHRGLEVRRVHHPAGLEPIHNTPSLELAATSNGVEVIAQRLILQGDLEGTATRSPVSEPEEPR